MATLRNLTTTETCLVEPEHIFGRASTCATQVQAGYVSAQHASLRWTSGRWVFRDLGSRNGSYLNGERLGVGEERQVRAGVTFNLGKLSGPTWELVNDDAPPIMAVPLDGGEPVLLSGELLAIPSSEDPQATIYRGTDTPWLIERADEATTVITNLQTFAAGDRMWRFCCPEEICQTSFATAGHDLVVRHLRLSFSVSRDEEHVSLSMNCGSRTFDMGARSHNYLLLTLARIRMKDAADGLPETSSGWIYQEDLARGLDLEPSRLNLDVYRLRRQFAAVGVADAANIIERRPRTRQLRIGTPHLSIVRL